MVVPPSSKSNHYKLLGVARDATADDIKAAYRCLARELHPDKNKETDAEERFKAVSLAYEVLGSPRRRREYDTCVLGEWSRGFAPSGVRRRNACGAGATDYVPPTSPPAGAALNRSLSRDAHEELRNARAARMERLKKTRDQRNAAPAKPEMTKEQKRFWKDRTEALRKKTPPPAAGAAAAAAAAAASRTKDDDEDTAAPATAAAPAASTAAPASAGAAAPSRAASSSHLSTSSARRHASSAGAPRVSGTEPVGGCVPMPMPRSKRPAAVPRHPPTSPRSDATDSGVDAAGVKEGRKRVPKKRSVVSKRSKEAKEAAAPAVDASDAEHEEPKTVRRRAPAGGGRGVRNVSVSPVRCPSGSVTFQRSLSSSSATGLSKVPKMTKMEAGSGLRALPTVWRSFSGMAKPPTYPATGKA
eukprot:Rhum_TRINITY_DN15109_c28_g1::Rhum_TRINITY_DN15109_c28_g1_i1::g.140373::m.140373